MPEFSTRRARSCLPVCIIVVFVLGFALPLGAQLGTGSIIGTVTDPTGAVVLGAKVTAVNSSTGFRRQTTSNEQGQYRFPGLVPGPYNLTIEVSGFKTYQRNNLTLQVDQNMVVDAVLEVGELTEVVEISGQAPLVQSTNASLGAVIDQQKITQLPLNGRNFVQLAFLVPGANTGAPGADNGGGVTVSGMRSEQNAFQIDGTSNSDHFQNRITVTPNIDSIQEFKMQTNNYSAEFGKGAGAQINLVTRGGTNQYHGALWEFLRNDAVQARRLFDRNRRSFPCDPSDSNVSTRRACAPPFNQNQFGFTFGGPVNPTGSDHKTFFFTSYEGFRQRRGNATLAEVPSMAQRQGDLSQNLITSKQTVPDALGRTWNRGQIFDPLSSQLIMDPNTGTMRNVRDPFVNNIIPQNRFDPVSLKMLNDSSFVPLPNAPGTIASDGNPRDNFTDGRSVRSDSDQFSVRIDHQFSPNDTVFGRYTMTDSTGFSPRSFPGFGNNDDRRNINSTLSYTKVLSPALVNEARLGYQGWFQNSASEDLGTDWHGKFGIQGFDYLNPGIAGSPSVSIRGFTGLGNGGGPTRRRSNTYQFIDNLSWFHGNHSMKVGFEVRRVQDSVTRSQTTRGDFSFTNPQWTGIDGVGNTGQGLGNMILGLVRQKGRRVSDFHSNIRSTEFGIYIQDDWKATQNLTLNLGVRYMLYLLPHEAEGQFSTLVHPTRCPSYSTVGCAVSQGRVETEDLSSPFVPTWGVDERLAASYNALPLPSTLTQVDKKNFGPRFGFAWKPFGSEKWVVRGGYAIFYDTVPAILSEDTIQNWPFVIEDQQDISLFQNGLPPAEGFFGFLLSNPGLHTGTSPGVAGFNPGPNIFSPNFRNAYMQNWNFTIQRELPGNMVAEIAYVGNKGTRLNRRQNTNTAEPLGINATIGDLSNDTSVRTDVGSGRNQFRRLVPFAVQDGIIVPLSNNFETTSTAFSTYHGLETRLEKRFTHGVTFITTFTWSKAISDASGFNDGGGAGTGNRIQNIFNVKADKGLADVDHRYRYTNAYVWDLPFGRGKKWGSSWSGITEKFLGGWGLDGILVLQSGYPITVRRSGDPGTIGTNGALRPDITCNPAIPRGEQSVERFFNTDCFVAPESLISGDVRFGTAGRATVQGPGIINFDLSIRKDTALTERVTTEFRAEFFNLPNHPSWVVQGSGRDFGSSNFGVVQSASDPRIIQFGLKLRF